MEWHFGYNCKHYLPSMSKCRILIDKYRKREDLVEQKWLTTQDILIYLNLSNEELTRQIYAGHIKAKMQKDGKLVFVVSGAWQYDECTLANGGGQCFYYEPHDGKKISCLMELKELEAQHPNFKNIPTEDAIRLFESEIIKTMGYDGDNQSLGLFR